MTEKIAMDGSAGKEGREEEAEDMRESGRTLAAGVYDKLREMLRNGELKPGVRVREAEIASRLGVSRTPVREAFSRLQSRRLVEVSHGRLKIIAFSRRQIVELFTTRGIVEGAAARLAAENASPAEVLHLRSLLTALSRAMGDPLLYSKKHPRFHEGIYEICHNEYMALIAQDLQDHLNMLPGTTFFKPGRIEEAQAQHEVLVDAIEARKPEEAETLAREYFKGVLNDRLELMFGLDQGSP